MALASLLLDVLAVSKWTNSYSVDLGLAAMPLPDIYDGEGFVAYDCRLSSRSNEIVFHGVDLPVWLSATLRV